jgi:Tol biopolymer transport system component
MDLPPKTRLGPYEIIAAIGAGGMGEVYRARDTRLDRCVAIKILPSHLSCTPELKSRFEREARTLSSVSHPNICHLYDVGCESGIYFLVMELLEGETLSDRLKKGPLPLNDLLRVAIEIADALAKTHRLGLIHRDLKPSNIMLTKTGAKLMDFGLAKPAAGDPFAGAETVPPNAETLITMQSPASAITTSGAIVGTLQYISPEQIDGKEADARRDIFALGAMLYEMATGQRAFDGKSRVAVASAILEKDPPLITALQPAAPPSLAYITSTCLAKDPEERFQTVHDVKLQLRWLTQPGATDSASAGKQATPRWWRLAIGLAAAIVLALVILFVKLASRPAAGEHGIVRFSVGLPPKQELAADVTQAVAISADGNRLAYVAAESGVSHLYVRRLDHLEPVAIPDSEGAIFPFFSPNGDWVAFFNQGKLKKAPADGGLPVAICELPSFFGGTWTPRDVIVVSIPNFGMATVPAVGGTLHKVSVATNNVIYPQGLTWLAGGDWVAFTDYLQSRRSIMALKLDSGEVRTLLDNAQSAYYAAGNLVYYQGGALWAVPFDSDKLQVLGASAEIEAGVNEENYIPQASVSRTGVLAYAPGPAGNFFRTLFLVNRKGVEQKLDLPPKDYIDLRNFAPTWAPYGKNLLLDAYYASRQHGIYRVAADGSSEPQLLRTISQTSHITSIAGDNAAVMVSDPVTTTDLWLLSMHPPYDMRPFKRTPAVERQGTLSPDGSWMAYASNESGRSEIYVEPVPGPGGRRQLSTEGGDQPRWVRNGREIIYRNGTKVMSVPVQLRSDFQPDKVVELFDRKFDPGAAVAGYDVSPDGQTFIMTRSEHDNPTEIRIVLGWPATEQPQK